MPRIHDGRDVDSSSDDWRLHYEARRLLQLDGYRRMGNDGRWTAVSPRRHRQQYLEGVLAARGAVERERLAAAALRLWTASPSGRPRHDESR
ncbi:hypothetical protein N5C16_04885 [Stenotrophomonas sp. GD03908]|uniref:Uncharacterized protein n=1 Tax=Stenotrophomonas maltophilia TaxID=40324 RepID=A0AAJ2TJC4_STEMA|nr:MULTISPECIES: hypothetical protein [Stenotrophomonas]MBH1481202.1 hypothetical protein [Stenotrophomonas maltophilia]MDH0978604.1 hypothetical protein [Stenotrophomonas sp. GD03908]MDQ7293067.1 hypothetical protein [Stenotrophomonas sp. Sm0041]MDZ5764239.1 hypothetical protein [Stenotrophomonas maltophilia]